MPIQNSIVVVNFNQAAALRRLLMTLKLEEAPAMEAIASHELVQAALRRLEERLDRFAPYPT